MTKEGGPAASTPDTRPAGSPWPSLPVAEWEATRDTLQLWTQIVGKVRMANETTLNHWWNVPLYVTARGLTNSLISHPSGQGFEIEFDLSAHQLQITTTTGGHRTCPLRPDPVAEFYTQVIGLLDDLGVSTTIWPVPVEIEGSMRRHTPAAPPTAAPGSCTRRTRTR